MGNGKRGGGRKGMSAVKHVYLVLSEMNTDHDPWRKRSGRAEKHTYKVYRVGALLCGALPIGPAQTF